MDVRVRVESELGPFLVGELFELSGDPPPYLYHYTGEAGLIASLKSQSLWASGINHLNDEIECRYAWSFLRATIERAYAMETENNAIPLFDCMRKRMIGSFDTSHLFLISFSVDGDELGMWRLYADRGRGASFSMSLRDVCLLGRSNAFLFKVQYDPSVLVSLCRRSLAEIRRMYLSDIAQGCQTCPEDYADGFLQNVIWLTPMFKAPVWSDEKEWRLVLFRNKAEHKARPDGRSYVEVTVDGPRPLPVADVCLGPKSEGLKLYERLAPHLKGLGPGDIYRSIHAENET